jgi:RimJ/RimL family protein N-acetyltransferase
MTTVEELRQLTLTGSRVRLRGLTEADLAHTLGWRNDERSLRWFKTSSPLQPDSHLAWFRGYLQGASSGCMFFAEGLDGQPIGQSSIYNVQGLSAEVGRFLSDPNLRGAGYFREALLLTLHAAFCLARLSTVRLEVIETNERAIRLYESVGFERIGQESGLIAMVLSAARFDSLDISPHPSISQTSSH